MTLRKALSSFSGVHWIKQRPLSDVTDPLGMNLRVGARLGGQLLYCITSVTQRARYYSFLPWCMMRYRKAQRGAPGDPGMIEAVFCREKALAVACVAHHGGQACRRGGVVGSREVVRNFAEFEGKSFSPRSIALVKDPALLIYIASLVNLGLVRETDTDGVPPEQDEGTDEHTSVSSWDDVELTEFGLDVANAYEGSVSDAPASRQLDDPAKRVSWQGVAHWASLGGYCELATEPSSDRQLLLDMFFCRRGRSGQSHELRRQSLLLILATAECLEDKDVGFDGDAFMSAVYTGRVEHADRATTIAIPPPLADIAARWKAYGSHVLLTTALQCLLSHVVSALKATEAHRVSLAELSQSLSDPALSPSFGKHAHVVLESRFGELTPASINALLASGPLAFEGKPSTVAFALAELLEDVDVRGGPAGLALALSLTAVLLDDYANWQAQNAGRWLTLASNDDTDVSPEIVLRRLEQRFANWRETRWQELTPFLLRKFVVGLHSNLAYEKQGRLLHLDGDQVRGNHSFDDVHAGFPRMRSAFIILQDLALLEDKDSSLGITQEGRELLATELKRVLRQ